MQTALSASVHLEDCKVNEVVLSLQVHTLLKGLEKIAASADIPMLVAGDFNSVPGSAAHDLLTKRSVEHGHRVSICSSSHRIQSKPRTGSDTHFHDCHKSHKQPAPSMV